METNVMQLEVLEDRCPDCGASVDVRAQGAELVLECPCGSVAALA